MFLNMKHSDSLEVTYMIVAYKLKTFHDMKRHDRRELIWNISTTGSGTHGNVQVSASMRRLSG
jgi:hypothetical protein